MLKRRRILTLLALMLVLSVLVSGCGGGTKPEKVDKEKEKVEEPQQEETDDTEEEDDADEVFVVGDTVAMGDLEFTLKGVRYDDGNDFLSPEDGEKWVVVDCEIQNNSDESASLSSIIMFNLVDTDGYEKDMELSAETKGSLDGELGKGRKMAGEIAYTVDEDETEWEFIFEPEVFEFGQAIFKVTEDDIE